MLKYREGILILMFLFKGWMVIFMLRRVLMLFGNEFNTKELLDTGKFLKDRYGCEIKALYVKDIRKHEIIPPSVEGLVIDPSSRYIVEEWDRFENERIETLKKNLGYLSEENLIIREGVTPDTALEELKAYDLLIIGKGSRISADIKELLKYHYKPLIIVGEKPINFDCVLVANDKSFRINKSFFRFMSIFEDVKEFGSISVGLDEEKDNSISEYLEGTGKVITEKECSGDEFEEIECEAENCGILIMGDLTHSYMLEKITGHAGVKLIENIKIPIFIA